MQRERTTCVSCVPVMVSGCGTSNNLENIAANLDMYRPHPLQMRAGLSKLGQGHLQVMETPQGLKVHTEEPHLVSLGGGRLSTSVTLLPLPPGRTRIGTTHANQPQDIVIQGTGVQSQHCYLVNHGGTVTLFPLALLCSVDGRQITAPTKLNQGCMLCLGRSNYFRFNHPQEAKRLRDNLPTPQPHPDLGPAVAKETRYISSPPSPSGHIASSSGSPSAEDKFRDSLEETEFVDKISRFEFLTHASSSSSPSSSSSSKSPPSAHSTRVHSPPPVPAKSPPIAASGSKSPITASGTKSPITASCTKSAPITASGTKSAPITASGTKSPSENPIWKTKRVVLVNAARSPSGTPSPGSPKKNPLSVSERDHSSSSPDGQKVNYSLELDVHCAETPKKQSTNIHVLKSEQVKNSTIRKHNTVDSKCSSVNGNKDKHIAYAEVYQQGTQSNNSSANLKIKSSNPKSVSAKVNQATSTNSPTSQQTTEPASNKDNRTPTFLKSPPKTENKRQTKPSLKQSRSHGLKVKVSPNQVGLSPAQLQDIGLDPSLSSSLADSPLKAILLSRSLSLDSASPQNTLVSTSSQDSRKSKDKSSSTSPIIEDTEAEENKSNKALVSTYQVRRGSSGSLRRSPSPSLGKASLPIDSGFTLTSAVAVGNSPSGSLPPSTDNYLSSSASPASEIRVSSSETSCPPLPKSKPPSGKVQTDSASSSNSLGSSDSGRESQSDSSRESARLITRSASPSFKLILSGDSQKSSTLPPTRSPTAQPDQSYTSASLRSPNKVTSSSSPLSKLPPPVPVKYSKPVTSDDNPWKVNLKDKLKPSLDHFKGEKVFRKDVVTTNVIVPGFENTVASKPSYGPVVTGTHSLPRPKKFESTEADKLDSGSSGYLSDSAVFGKVAREKKKEPSLAVCSYTHGRCELDKVVHSTDSDSDDESLYAQVPDTDHCSLSSPSLESLDDVIEEDTLESTEDKSKIKNNMALSNSGPRSPRSPHITLGTRGLTTSPSRSPTSPKETASVFVHSLDDNANCNPSVLTTTEIDNELSIQIANLAAADHNMANLHVNGVSDSDSNSSETKSVNLDDISLDDLTESQRNLKDLHDRMREERKKEQEMAAQEQQRLEDILNMCAEYEKQLEREQAEKQEQAKSPTDTRKDLRNSMTKIKTNGSLGKIGSPTSTHKEINVFEFGSSRRHSSSSASEEEGSEHGTIKRRPTADRSPLTQIPPPVKSPNINTQRDANPAQDLSSSVSHQTAGSQSTASPNSPIGASPYNNESAGLNLSYPNSCISQNTVQTRNPGTPRDLISQQVLTQSTTVNDSESVWLVQNNSNTPDTHLGPVFRENSYESSPRSSMSESRTTHSPHSPLSDCRSVPDSESDRMISPQSPPSDAGGHFIINYGEQENHEAKLSCLHKDRHQCLWRVAQMKQRVADIETQENEAIRELELERALLEGEHQNITLQLQDDQGRMRQLKQRQTNLHSACIVDQHKERVEEHKMKMEELESLCDFTMGQLDKTSSPNDRQLLEEQLQSQHEQLDLQRKIYDDLEFQQLEIETRFEEEKDVVQHELIEEQTLLLDKYKETKDRLLAIDQQQKDMLTQAKLDIDQLEAQRRTLVDQIKKESSYLSENERQIRELSKMLSLESPIITQPSPRSDIHLQYQPDKKNMLAKTNEEYIKQIKADAYCLTPPNGQKMSQTLIDIERNRQSMLDKQGAEIIEEERRRLRDLKQRAAVESQQQWEASSTTQRQAQCVSFLSVESEDSSNLSSGTPSDKETSLSSGGDDHLGKLTEMEKQMQQHAGILASSSLMSVDTSAALMELEQERKRRIDLEHKLQQEVAHRQELVEKEVKVRQKQKAQARPLTCYLPVRNSELDLRHFIEMSGHNIDDCPHITMDDKTCRGFLTKMGSKIKTWNKRWFLFDRSRRALLYFSDKTESKPRGGIYFQSIMDVFVDHMRTVKSPTPKLTFCVKTHDRTYYLVAPSAEAMRIWINVIFTGAEGYQEYA